MPKSFYLLNFSQSSQQNSEQEGLRKALVAALQKTYPQTNVFHPIIDSNAICKSANYGLTSKEALELIATDQQPIIIEKIINKYKKLEQQSDFVLINGFSLCPKNSSFWFNLNTELALNLSGLVLGVFASNQADGQNGCLSCPVEIGSIYFNLLKKQNLDILGLLCLTDLDLETVGNIEKEMQAKIPNTTLVKACNPVLSCAESCKAPEEFIANLKNFTMQKVTPKLFEYKLIEMAKTKKMRIVLPESYEPRVIKAADYILKQGIADIIFLGDENKIKALAKDLKADIALVEVINPATSPYFENYVQTYFEARQHKGVSLEKAREMMLDVTYFGTMMVHKGQADGLVSGSVNTTAHTIRPALEFIKTKPGIKTVSSIFLMCLPDRVYSFGDCAVVPNPSPEQLASIALSSAETATIFGIEPKVAMLSYSSGSSGKGPDVEKVIEATKIAKELKPNLALDGPLQYDAAVDPEVARTKLPDSPVAGKATIFVFPDLESGNIAYKAVQRSVPGLLAVGPVLQGLNKPVNDLSRGCSVADIAYTVAITAIQAQNNNS